MSDEDIIKKAGFKEEEAEEVFNQHVKTGFPKPIKRFRIVMEKYNMSIEEAYYWVLDNVKGMGYPPNNIYKTIDTFSASENSAFFGVSQMRLGGQQDKISGLLATMGKMIKELFQLVRELRIIDERKKYYLGSWGKDEEGNKLDKGFNESDEVTLKGIWIDMVEGGSKNPSSVFGMSREVQFVSLPDLFFSTHPRTAEDVDEVVEKERGQFNQKVKKVLKRKLAQYLRWKEETYKELCTRREFTLKYLRQHYDIIKMYMAWVRPYLKHVKRLSMDEKKMESPDLVLSFEGSMIEIEFLATKKSGKGFGCILAHFDYRTRPAMSYQQEGYQRGPIHIGKATITLRAYAWSQNNIDSYLKMKDEQDMELMKSVSGSVESAMKSMGGALKDYLKEAGEKFSEDEEKEKAEKDKEKPSIKEKIKHELFGPSKTKAKDAKKDKSVEPKESDLKGIEKGVKKEMFLVFKNFKKAHGMVMW